MPQIEKEPANFCVAQNASTDSENTNKHCAFERETFATVLNETGNFSTKKSCFHMLSSRVAGNNIVEAGTLVEQGFDCVTDDDEVKLFRKRK